MIEAEITTHIVQIKSSIMMLFLQILNARSELDGKSYSQNFL